MVRKKIGRRRSEGAGREESRRFDDGSVREGIREKELRVGFIEDGSIVCIPLYLHSVDLRVRESERKSSEREFAFRFRSIPSSSRLVQRHEFTHLSSRWLSSDLLNVSRAHLAS